jgi:hypothetical protein
MVQEKAMMTLFERAVLVEGPPGTDSIEEEGSWHMPQLVGKRMQS